LGAVKGKYLVFWRINGGIRKIKSATLKGGQKAIDFPKVETTNQKVILRSRTLHFLHRETDKDPNVMAFETVPLLPNYTAQGKISIITH